MKFYNMKAMNDTPVSLLVAAASVFFMHIIVSWEIYRNSSRKQFSMGPVQIQSAKSRTTLTGISYGICFLIRAWTHCYCLHPSTHCGRCPRHMALKWPTNLNLQIEVCGRFTSVEYQKLSGQAQKLLALSNISSGSSVVSFVLGWESCSTWSVMSSVVVDVGKFSPVNLAAASAPFHVLQLEKRCFSPPPKLSRDAQRLKFFSEPFFAYRPDWEHWTPQWFLDQRYWYQRPEAREQRKILVSLHWSKGF